ncbi:hypothetical protein [Pseudoroseicyclus aestuarii]|nr:hypothetical protein [Pseudoroseicyclus aestuarii]
MIKSAAAEAKMAIGPFLAEAVRKTQIVRRSDWEAGLGKLIEAMALLEGISQRVAGMPDPLDRIETVAALLSVERRLHRIATPWLADDAEGDGA